MVGFLTRVQVQFFTIRRDYKMLDYYLRPERTSIFLEEEITGSNWRVIVPFAFGRNTWPDSEVNSRLQDIRPRGLVLNELEMFHRLHALDFDPGDVNACLAEIVYRQATENTGTYGYFFPIHGQWEVMYALYRRHTQWYERHYCEWNSPLRALWPSFTDDVYLSTRDIFKRFRFNQAIYPMHYVVVAQAIHAERCVRVGQQELGNDYVHKAPVTLPNFYDSQSVQPWTRDQKSFITQERVARVYDKLPASGRWLARKTRKILGK